jgi:hypothetical protein
MEDFNLVEDSAMQAAAKGFNKILAVVIILSVAAFGDIMYLVLMQSKFPGGGPLLVMCYLGAFTSFAATGYLLLGKTIAFTPGAQLLAAWVVFFMEMALIVMNILLVFGGPDSSDFMHTWFQIAPATPVFNMVGCALIFFLDSGQRRRHRAMEYQDKIDRADLDYQLALAKSRVTLKYKQLKYTATALEEAVNSPESQLAIRQHGYALNQALLTELTGRSYGNQLYTQTPQLAGPANGVPLTPAQAAALDQSSVPAQPAQFVQTVPSSAPEPEPARLPKRSGLVGGFKNLLYGNNLTPKEEAEARRKEMIELSIKAEAEARAREEAKREREREEAKQAAAQPAAPAPAPAGPQPSEKTSNQIYREERRRAKAANARLHRRSQGNGGADAAARSFRSSSSSNGPKIWTPGQP